MKRMTAVLLALLLCFSMACVVTAAESDFVPSISYKPEPDVHIVSEGHDDSCILITPVSKAEKSDKLSEDAKKQLLDLYDRILKDKEDFSTVAGLDEFLKKVLGNKATVADLVVRDLFDVTAVCDDLKREVINDGESVDLIFDLKVKKEDAVVVLGYKNDKWELLKSVNNGDGTITATFDYFGPVAFLVPTTKPDGPSETGDSTNQQVVLWVALAALSLLTVGGLFAINRRTQSGN